MAMRQSDARHAESLREADPAALGRRLRSSRVARGWTQSDVAADILSVGYLSRIESGARRPTLKVLAALAERLEKSIDELLLGTTVAEYEEIRLGLAYAELALQNGEAIDAELQARQHLARAEKVALPGLVEQGRFLVARATEAVGHLDEAIRQFESLLETATGLPAIRCAIALSRCYREVGDLALAIEVGERVRPTVEAEGLARTDEAVQLAMTVAAAHIERGDLSRASRICTDAIDVAEQMESSAARSAAYWNASIVCSERGDPLSALALAERALALLGEGEDARNLARLRLELGRLQLSLTTPQVDAAIEQLARGCEELRSSSASAGELAHGDVLLAQALLLAGEPERAVELAEAARSSVPDEASLAMAEATVVLGEAQAALGRSDDARRNYDRAMRLLSGLDRTDRWVAQVWCELAELYDELGDLDASRAALRGAVAASGLRVRSRQRARTST